MVVFVDFEQDGDDELHHHAADDSKLSSHMRAISSQPDYQQYQMTGLTEHQTPLGRSDERTNPNINAFSASLSCYPIIKQIAQFVDLNTLHSLSRTCRQFRANLIPFRSQLIKLTLRCENEYEPRQVDRYFRLSSGKIGLCARDMVAECRRCARVVCRNCCTKPPSDAMLRQRLRRLCVTCHSAALSCHLSPPSSIWPDHGLESHSFTAMAFQRTPCVCEDSVWLCKPCGRSLANDDTTYSRCWTWRTRYSTYLGGLGTGIGEGCQGVKCGKGKLCLAAQDIEVEIDCCVEEWAANQHNHGHGPDQVLEAAPYQATEGRDGRDDEEPGYLRQEIEGIGGVVKRKVKKRFRVGACVEEHEDERETGAYLEREQSGQDRSWCGWCSRLVLSEKDLSRN